MYALTAFKERIHHYLLITLTLAFLSGLLLQRFFQIDTVSAAIISFLLLLVALFYHKRQSSLATLFLLLTVLSLAIHHSASFDQKHSGPLDIYSKITKEEDAVLTGTLHRMVLFDGELSTVIVKSNNLRLHHEDSFSPCKGLVQLRLKDSWPTSIVPGDEIVIRTKLSRPYSFGNPGGFDYPEFLASQNIRIIGRISSVVHISPLYQNKLWLHKLRYFPENIRISIRDLISNNLPAKEAAIYRALLIGDRSGLDKETLEAFKTTGTMHILAISGMHLSLVATLLFLFFHSIAKRSQYLLLHISCKKLALLASIPPLCFYALLAGAQTPVIRSLIMVLSFIFAFCIHRQRSPFTTLSFAALLILLINPTSLFTVSFQLSFAAVASLILIFPRLSMFFQNSDEKDRNTPLTIFIKTSRWIMIALLVSITATIGTAPLLILNFNHISTIGPVVNLLLEPLLCLWSLPLGLLAIVIHFFDSQTSVYFLQTGAIGIHTATIITDCFQQYDLSTLWLPTPSPALVILYYLTLWLCFTKLAFKKTLPLFLGITLLFIFSPQSFFQKFSSDSEVTFLDVGQGTASLVSFPGGKKVLIDGGGAFSKRFNVGESVIARYLWEKGITHLDSIVVTHPDADHYNGIPFILKQFNPEILWVNGEDGHDEEYVNLIELAHELGITVRTPLEDEILLQSSSLKLLNINNPFSNNKLSSENSLYSNDMSLILQLKGESFSCLFPGDISSRAEHALLKNKTNLESSILLSPHHGSKTSNSEEFLTSVNPQQIVVSAGRFKPLYFPTPELRALCRKLNIPLLITSEMGAITFRQNGRELKYTTFLKQDS
jgi:competence protein ComEC